MTNFINKQDSKAPMITITFPDGKEKEFETGISIAEIAKSIGPRLFDAALAAKANGKLVDLSTKIEKNAVVQIITFTDKEGKDVFRHSSAHVLAHAVLRIFPDAKPTIGPVVDEGFFYDFDFRPFTPEDLVKLEEEMQKIVKENISVERIEYKTKDEAKKVFKENKFKCELIETAEEGLSAYKQGDFVDLCRGPHIPSTGKIKAFKLTKVASAYWRGDAKNKQLSRIYGISFPDKKLLDEHLHMLEEAEKRDHRKIGKEQDLFFFSELVGSGLPLWTPKGTILRNLLDGFVYELRSLRGYQKVTIPHITKKELYMTSGHWQKYADDLFKIKTREGHEFAMKPMNCPHHTQIFGHIQRSYRDMPQRYCETTMVYRDEQTGELAGLSRVLCITQDDAHVFCRESQVKEEAFKIWDIINIFYGSFGFELKVRLSLHDPEQFEKYIGTKEQWKRAEDQLKEFVKERNATAVEAIGEAAFYGPKLDFIAQDSLGRRWQVATIQVDRNMPERFDLFCMNEKGEKERIVMLHAAIMGSIERFLAVLIEHLGGKFPLWLSPEQIRILPIADRHNAYAMRVKEELQRAGLRVQVDDMAETTPKKVRQAQLDQVNYILVIGDKEVENKTVNVRTRDNVVHGEKNIEVFTKELLQEIHDKKM